MYTSENPFDLGISSSPAERARLSGRARTNSHRSIVFVSSPGRVPSCVVDAVEREFPRFCTEHVEDIEDIGMDFGYPVGLFLIDKAFLPGLDEKIRRHRDRHRHATVAVLFDDVESARADFPSICRSEFVRSVLPMNLKLDVWLSVVGLLLRGGEYFPASLMRRWPSPNRLRFRQPYAFALADPVAPPQAGMVEAQEADLNELTEREREVLRHVAQGTQNKMIASELGLSEHTVKIHIHNIIRKLRVRNRTEAAAVFLQSSMSGRGGGGTADPGKA